MSIQLLKLDLKDWLLSVKDITVLNAINEIRLNQDKIILEKLPEEIKNAVDQATFQLKSKDVISHQEMMEATKKRYSEYFGN